MDKRLNDAMERAKKFTFTKQELVDIQKVIEGYLKGKECVTTVLVTHYTDGFEVGIKDWEIGQEQTQEIKSRLKASGYDFYRATAFQNAEFFWRGTVILLQI